jgi:hypothetical protein
MAKRRMSKNKERALTAVTIWDTAWKLAAVWKAVRYGQKRWVPPLVVVNSAGILPILYFFVFARDRRLRG